MAEGARLESVCRGNSTEGSNPSLSATQRAGTSGVTCAYALRGSFTWRRHQLSFPGVSNTEGEVPEWSNGAVSKTVDRASGPWVRIPPSPP